MKIYINEDALKIIYKEVQISRNIETGGILLGSVLLTGDILITHATNPGPNAIKKQNEFQKDYDYSNEIINMLYKKYSIDYLGEWHKHPNNCVKYSSIDYASMIKITNLNSRPCLFIIVGNDFSNENRQHISILSVDPRENIIKSHEFNITKEPEKLAIEKGLRFGDL
ncbi:hypothetical protein [Clostridium sartagoforme]|uniref:hypothetical protein n=1 Tax=Clostridium sartagoforme TaxID=84031 RepID=UPI0031D6305C